MSELAIIGAQITGHSLALGCDRRGWDTTLCERSPRLETVGAGLTLGSSTVSGLGYLGQGDANAGLAAPSGPAIVLDWATGRLWRARRVARAIAFTPLIASVRRGLRSASFP